MKSNLKIIEADSVIVSMTRAASALAEAKTIQQTKKILDVAAAAEIYARRQKLGAEAGDLAASIKVDALRQLGEMLKATPKAKGEILRGDKLEPRGDEAPTLADLGLTKKESMVAQKLANLSEEEFEQVREGNVSVAKAIAAVTATKPTSTATETASTVTAEQRAPGPVTVVEDEGDEAFDLAEIQHAEQVQAETLAAYTKAMESDDPLGVAMQEVKRLTALNNVLQSRLDGLMNEKNELVSRIKGLQRKLDKVAA